VDVRAIYIVGKESILVLESEHRDYGSKSSLRTKQVILIFQFYREETRRACMSPILIKYYTYNKESSTKKGLTNTCNYCEVSHIDRHAPAARLEKTDSHINNNNETNI